MEIASSITTFLRSDSLISGVMNKWIVIGTIIVISMAYKIFMPDKAEVEQPKRKLSDPPKQENAPETKPKKEEKPECETNKPQVSNEKKEESPKSEGKKKKQKKSKPDSKKEKKHEISPEKKNDEPVKPKDNEGWTVA